MQIPHAFLHQGRGKIRTQGPLAALCQNRDEDGLDLCLIFDYRAEVTGSFKDGVGTGVELPGV